MPSPDSTATSPASASTSSRPASAICRPRASRPMPPAPASGSSATRSASGRSTAPRRSTGSRHATRGRSPTSSSNGSSARPSKPGRFPSPGESWGASGEARIVEIAEEEFADFERRGLTGHPAGGSSTATRSSTCCCTTLRARRRGSGPHSGATPVAVELTFGRAGHRAPPGRTRRRTRGSAGRPGRPRRRGPGRRPCLRLQVRQLLRRTDRSGRPIADGGDPLDGGRRLQLLAYAEAAAQQRGIDRTQRLVLVPRPGHTGVHIGYEIGPEHRQLFRETLRVLVDGVGDGLYPAHSGPDIGSPAPTSNCAYCEFDTICPADREDEWERVRADPLLDDVVRLAEEGSPAFLVTAPTGSPEPMDGADDEPRRPTMPQPGTGSSPISTAPCSSRRAPAPARPRRWSGASSSLVLDGADVAGIAAITFTEAAAAELRARIREALEDVVAGRPVRRAGDRRHRRPASSRAARPSTDLDRATISTLHAFAQRLLLSCTHRGRAAATGRGPRRDLLRAAHPGPLGRVRRIACSTTTTSTSPSRPRSPSTSRMDHLAGVASTFNQNWDLLVGLDLAVDRALVIDEADLDAVDRPAARRGRTSSGAGRDLHRRRRQAGSAGSATTWTTRSRRCSRPRRPTRTPCSRPSPSPPKCRAPRAGRPTGRTAARPRSTSRGTRPAPTLVDARAAIADLRRAPPVGRGGRLHARRGPSRGGARGGSSSTTCSSSPARCSATIADVRRRMHDRYQHLLIDEFQDTDPIQVELAVRIAADPDHDTARPVGRGRGRRRAGCSSSATRSSRSTGSGGPTSTCSSAPPTATPRAPPASTPTSAPSAPSSTFCNPLFGDHHRARGTRRPADGTTGRRPRSPSPTTPTSMPGATPSPATRARRSCSSARAEKESTADSLRTAEADRHRRHPRPRRTPSGWLVHPEGDESAPCRWGDMAVLLPSRTSLPHLRRALRSPASRTGSRPAAWSSPPPRSATCSSILRAVDDPGDEIALHRRPPLAGLRVRRRRPAGVASSRSIHGATSTLDDDGASGPGGRRAPRPPRPAPAAAVPHRSRDRRGRHPRTTTARDLTGRRPITATRGASTGWSSSTPASSPTPTPAACASSCAGRAPGRRQAAGHGAGAARGRRRRRPDHDRPRREGPRVRHHRGVGPVGAVPQRRPAVPRSGSGPRAGSTSA